MAAAAEQCLRQSQVKVTIGVDPMFPKVIRWKRQWGGKDRVVWVIVRKLDEAWKRDPVSSYYIPRGQCRHHPFGSWLSKFGDRERAHMPHIGFYDGYVSFTDGRHRFAWCRDHGVTTMPVSVESKSQATLVANVLGSRLRVCRLPAANWT